VYDLDNIAVTTSQPRSHLIKIAHDICQEINVKFIPKENSSIKKLKEKYQIKHLIVVREDRIQVSNDQVFFFHPGMSVPRIKVLRKGQQDTMVKAMDLKTGDKVLDCTLGIANDAIVASYVVGEEGQVVGLESSPLIYIITKLGLKSCKKGSKVSQEAMKNIKVIWANYETYLTSLPDDYFDVVYFDPMFEIPIYQSSGINGLRNLANYQQLDKYTIMEALRVARKRVVIKDRANSSKLLKLEVDEIQGGRYSPISFGIYHK